MDDEAALTITVPEAGAKYFGLSRDASYAAAQRGDIPTIRVGRLLRVPVRAMERLLDSSERNRGTA
jgi:excisionase family DNA binding protein